MEPRGHIKVYRLFIEPHGLVGAPELGRQVARPVEQRDIGRIVVRELVDGLAVHFQGLFPLLILLEATGLFLQKFNTAHRSALVLVSDIFARADT